ncbi:MAG: hypothetical protein AB7R89_28420 [Dehalococcoidia bacterium]
MGAAFATQGGHPTGVTLSPVVVTPLLLDLDRLRPEWRDAINRSERGLLEAVAQAASPPDAPLPPHVVALVVLSSINWTHYWFDPNGPLSTDDPAHGMATLFAPLACPPR